MLSSNQEALKYIYDYKDGKIKQGLKIDCILDNHLVYKQGEFNMFLGLDNVGKTNWIMWYFTVLTFKHGIKWCIWSGENKVGQIKRDMIQYLSKTNIRDLSKPRIKKINDYINKYFLFVDNRKIYSHKELLKIFKENECDACLIDPYTGLNHDRKNISQFDRNYNICNDIREFCNKTKKSIYISIHPQTESARRIYPVGHLHEGHIQPPRKADTEGGQVFPNRVDNFVCLHRMISNKVLWSQTELHVYKIKDKETGGTPTMLGEPLRFDWNKGLGFTIGGINPLSKNI